MREDTDSFLAHRGRLLGLAYRMLGSMSDAEDIVQDAWLKYSRVDTNDLQSEEGYLVTIVTRLCLDRLKSAQRQREDYIGPWLPEPVAEGGAMNPEAMLEFSDDLSFALLLTLERLSPPERAAFLLHDVFGAPFSAVAEALGRNEASCRQLAARARKAVRAERPAGKTPDADHKALLTQFAAAMVSGDTAGLQDLLAEDAIAYTDGGGVKIAALNPIYGADRIARFFTGIAMKAKGQGAQIRAAFETVNAQPALLGYVDGELDQTMSIDVRGGRITAIYVVRNPEKLRRFPPRADA